jgi:hypothetical protein
VKPKKTSRKRLPDVEQVGWDSQRIIRHGAILPKGWEKLTFERVKVKPGVRREW